MILSEPVAANLNVTRPRAGSLARDRFGRGILLACPAPNTLVLRYGTATGSKTQRTDSAFAGTLCHRALKGAVGHSRNPWGRRTQILAVQQPHNVSGK